MVIVKAFWRKTYAKVLKQSRNLACRNGSREGRIGILPRERRKKRARDWIAGFSWNTRKSKLSVRTLGRILDNEAGKVGTLDFSKQF